MPHNTPAECDYRQCAWALNYITLRVEIASLVTLQVYLYLDIGLVGKRLQRYVGQ